VEAVVHITQVLLLLPEIMVALAVAAARHLEIQTTPEVQETHLPHHLRKVIMVATIPHHFLLLMCLLVVVGLAQVAVAFQRHQTLVLVEMEQRLALAALVIIGPVVEVVGFKPQLEAEPLEMAV
jgi:hypothetical protein